MANIRLLLHCNVRDSTYTLKEEGAAETHTFDDLEDALHHASKMVSRETALIVFNEQGQPIIETSVNPPVA